jgi:hypothetical protein
MSVNFIDHAFKALAPKREVAKCDVCDERPGIRTVWPMGVETLVCGPCGGDPEPQYPCYACGEESTHEIIHRGSPLDCCDECDLEGKR